MNRANQKNISHKNNLSGYVSNWLIAMNHIKKTQPPEIMPRAAISYNDNVYDLSLTLSYLNDNLKILEETPITHDKFNYIAYAQARYFLKVCYILLRVLLDDISGIIKFFYDNNEPDVGVPKSFEGLLNKAGSQKLPEDLITLLKPTSDWFREMRKRKDDLVHRYESLLISLRQGENGENILGHFSTMGHTTKEYEDIR
jgi:hypothetical protein